MKEGKKRGMEKMTPFSQNGNIVLPSIKEMSGNIFYNTKK